MSTAAYAGSWPARTPHARRSSSCPLHYLLDHTAQSIGIAQVVMSLAGHPFDMAVSHLVNREALALARVLDHDHMPLRKGGYVHRAPGRSHHLTPAKFSGGSSGGTSRCEILSVIGAASLSLADTHGTRVRPPTSTIWTTRHNG
jgi:hypothetical protein